jgi:dihydroorotase
MRILIHSASVIDSGSPFDGQKVDVLVENGLIRQMAQRIDETADQVIEAEGLYLSVGWLDMRVSAKDPGQEHKEDLQSVSRAAAAGGFTEIAVLPDTHPAIQTKEAVVYQRHAGERGPVRIHPIASVTLKNEGKELAEMIDLHHAGAVAFSDGEKPVWHTDIFVKTLQYLQPFGGLLINRPEDTLLTRFGTMNEGISSTLLGLKGMPKLAEEMMIVRDLQLLEYVTTPGQQPVALHFSLLSSARSVELIREAKRRGLPVSCDIAAHQIAFDDTALADFDTNLKVNPPFRSQEDIAALWEGLADGTIDAIVSDHNPQDEESKKLEFDLAEFGIIGLETAFAVVNTYNQHLSLPQLIEKLTTQPRRILRMSQPRIEVGQPANLTLFDAHTEWTFTEADIRSKSRNTPFVGKTLKGRPVATIQNERLTISQAQYAQ